MCKHSMEYKLNLINSSSLKKRLVEKVLIIGLTILIIVVVFNDLKKMLVEEPVPPRQVELLESFELIWDSSADSLLVLTDEGTVRNPQIYMYLDASKNQLILPILEGNFLFLDLYLTDFELDTGEIQWQTMLDSNQLALTNNSKNIFAVVREDEKCTPDERGYCDAVRISSYNLSSGEEEWVTYHGDMNRANTLRVNDKILSITGFATRSNFREKVSLATETGEKLDFQDINSPRNSFLENWHPNRLGFNEFSIVGSSYEQNGKFLFFLTEQNHTLWAIDLDTYEILGWVEFDGPSFMARDYTNEFKIVSDNDVVVVYLGDSEQLFAFRFFPDK